ncbi:MAG: CPBP family intramembrane metalloprotease [Simkaniaceae bacterium]|nr:CPBP family intramembrane metalloprotease [Simkaniaceae bacterium]
MTIQLGLFSLVIHLILWKKGFFFLSSEKSSENRLTFLEVTLSFLIYFALFYALLFTLFQSLSSLCNPKLLLSLLQLLMAALAIPLWLCFFSKKAKSIFKWGSSSFLTDIALALVVYLISLPIIALVNEGAEQINLYFFGDKGPDQGAVLYLKSVKEHPVMFSLTLISIVIIAPLVEEVLFRGLLQRYIKQCLGGQAALLLSSLFFALMHFQLAQGIGNIPLLISLFVFALYLGFIYEKQKSLVASITLHIVFNLVSVVRIVGV